MARGLDVPHSAYATRIRAPGGRPAWMPAVFGADTDVRCENGDDTADPMSGFDVTRKVLSFGYFSLHQQRNVTRRQAKALCPNGWFCLETTTETSTGSRGDD